MEKLKKYSSDQLMKKIVSSKSTPEEKLFCEQVIMERSNLISNQSKKPKFKRPESVEIKETPKEIIPEVIVTDKPKGKKGVEDKPLKIKLSTISNPTQKEMKVQPENKEFLPSGTKVQFTSSPRSKGGGVVLSGFIIRNFFDNQDKCDYYYIKVGTDKYCKKVNAVNKL